MTLYVDLLFFLNLFVNYLLLRLTGFAVSRRPRLWRLLAAAAVGALGAFYILLPVQVAPVLSVVVEFFYKLLLCGVITLICFGFGSLRRFLKAASAFLLLSFALAGILLCGMLLFRPAGMLVSGSAVYFQISPLVLVISTIVCYLLLRLLERLSARIRMSGHHYRVTIVLNGRRVDGDALLDSGNSLRDHYSGDPVVVADYTFIKPLLPPESRPLFSGGQLAPRTTGGVPGFRFVLYHAVGKEYGILPAFRPDYMLLTAGNRTYTYQDITVAVSPKSAGAGRQALLPAQVLAKME